MKKDHKNTQINQIIKHLRKHKHITIYESMSLYGATRLSAIIFRLKTMGFEIETKKIQKKTRYGTIARNIADYYLVKDVDLEVE